VKGRDSHGNTDEVSSCDCDAWGEGGREGGREEGRER